MGEKRDKVEERKKQRRERIRSVNSDMTVYQVSSIILFIVLLSLSRGERRFRLPDFWRMKMQCRKRDKRQTHDKRRRAWGHRHQHRAYILTQLLFCCVWTNDDEKRRRRDDEKERRKRRVTYFERERERESTEREGGRTKMNQFGRKRGSFRNLSAWKAWNKTSLIVFSLSLSSPSLTICLIFFLHSVFIFAILGKGSTWYYHKPVPSFQDIPFTRNWMQARTNGREKRKQEKKELIIRLRHILKRLSLTQPDPIWNIHISFTYHIYKNSIQCHHDHFHCNNRHLIEWEGKSWFDDRVRERARKVGKSGRKGEEWLCERMMIKLKSDQGEERESVKEERNCMDWNHCCYDSNNRLGTTLEVVILWVERRTTSLFLPFILPIRGERRRMNNI